ncbi:MAG: xanthine dehydrogenase family protein subunit M [Desulfobacterota bacterium]|nr:xanthine dehydrogenase family protein subunit M [Thermodesulfobacteriota bacterium]
MRPFEFFTPSTISEAIRLLNKPHSYPLAGGTDLLGELKRGIRRVDRMVNLKAIPRLKKIVEGKMVRIGGLVTLAEIEEAPLFAKSFPLLSQAASLVASKQLRNLGTLAGNLLQRPRCWYYRNAPFHCWLKGGRACFAIGGENAYHAILGAGHCQAVHPSDLAPALIALDSEVEIVGPKGRRRIPLEALYRNPTERDRQVTLLKRNEIITAVLLNRPFKGSKGIFLKAGDRKAWSFALVSVAAFLILKGGKVSSLRLVLGGVAPYPWRVKEVEGFLEGKQPSEERIRRASEMALAKARPLKENGYKIPLAKALIEKALTSLL